MPGCGGGLVRLEFSGRTPWPATLVTALLFANLIGSFSLDYWVQHYAPRAPSVGSPFSLRLTPSVVAFVPSWVGRYEQGSLWLHFIFLGLLFVLFGLYALKGQVIVQVERPNILKSPVVIAGLLVFLFILTGVVLSQVGWLR
jgi:ABC-type Na+ efflux pump permease subunit